MRTSISLGLPLDLTAAHLRALAALVEDLEAARWDKLAASCTRMGQHEARWPPPAALLLERLADQLGRAADDRAGLDLVLSDRL